MNKPAFRVVGLDQSTCVDEYRANETASTPSSAQVLGAELSIYRPTLPATVTVRLRDMFPALRQATTTRLAWVNDFADDPIVITKDLYDVLLTYQRLKNAA